MGVFVPHDPKLPLMWETDTTGRLNYRKVTRRCMVPTLVPCLGL
jgi:hypothetical protein